jgi:hypothetical protein
MLSQALSAFVSFKVHHWNVAVISESITADIGFYKTVLGYCLVAYKTATLTLKSMRASQLYVI